MHFLIISMKVSLKKKKQQHCFLNLYDKETIANVTHLYLAIKVCKL